MPSTDYKLFIVERQLTNGLALVNEAIEERGSIGQLYDAQVYMGKALEAIKKERTDEPDLQRLAGAVQDGDASSESVG